MKAGDLIVLKDFTKSDFFKVERKAVVLYVTQSDINQGTDALKPGLYAFYGLWYGDDPLDHRGYGKMVYARGRVVGQVKNQKSKKFLI